MKTMIKKDPEVTVWSEKQGILILTPGSWTVAIAKDDAIKYANQGISYNQQDGFIRLDDEGDVIFSHNESKITLDNNSANAVIELIRTAEKEIWS